MFAGVSTNAAQMQAGCDSQQADQKPCKDDLEALEALTCLRFAAWPALPAQAVERRPAAPASTASLSQHSGSEQGEPQQPQQPQQLSGSRRPRSDEGGEEEAHDGAESQHRPAQRKQRVLPPPGTAGLQRRTYTWRGLHSRRAEKQQRQLEALSAAQQGEQQQQQDAQQDAQQQQQQQQQAPSAAPALSSVSWLPTPAAAGTQKEGDREFAALTTWLRMNIHHPRTAKKVVPFVGQRDPATQRWAFRLNPALRWGDVGADMRRRLAGLPQEAAQAFARKYPARRTQDWRLKSQKYKPPGSSQTHLVLLEDLVCGLHAVWRAHEGGEGDGSAAAESATAPAVACPAAAGAKLASCGSSAALAAP